ncbi:MAG: PaaI family thioesterase [Myxococcota bacterium]
MNDRAERQREFVERWEALLPPTSGAWVQKRRLATAMRRVISRLVQSNAPESELRGAADALERYSTRLATHPRLRREDRDTEAPADPDVGTFVDQSPLTGMANPLAPPIVLQEEDEWRVVGRVRYGAAYEGPPGCVHGGFIAAAFDEVLGFVQGMSGETGFTGTLTVRFRSPAPLHRELRLVGEIVRVSGRKIFTEGRMLAGDLLCAESEGLFITPHPEQYQRMVEARLRSANRGE